jgi:hypothetical protein
MVQETADELAREKVNSVVPAAPSLPDRPSRSCEGWQVWVCGTAVVGAMVVGLVVGAAVVLLPDRLLVLVLVLVDGGDDFGVVEHAPKTQPATTTAARIVPPARPAIPAVPPTVRGRRRMKWGTRDDSVDVGRAAFPASSRDASPLALGTAAPDAVIDVILQRELQALP